MEIHPISRWSWGSHGVPRHTLPLANGLCLLCRVEEEQNREEATTTDILEPATY